MFPAKLVGDNLIPGRFYRITANFLRKMADQAKAGISLLLDHSWANLGIMTIPIGRTFDSRIQQDGDELALYADHYMKLGQEVGEVKTSQIADGIDAGTIFDTSIGFIGTKHTCSICGNDYYDYRQCEHFRGRTYDGKVCTVDIDDGFLMENSLVFDGAYPGAGVVGLSNKKGQQEPSNWEALSEDMKSLPGDGRVFYSFSSKSGLMGFVPKEQPQQQQQTKEEAETLAEGDGNMDGKENAVQLQQVQAVLGKATGLLSQIRTALGIDSDDGILSKIAALSSQAADGVAYKAKVVEETCGAGVRALGEAFNVEAMKLSFNALAVSEVEKVRDTYNAQAQAIFGNGGRKTEGGDIQLPANAQSGAAPANPQANGGQQTPEQLQAKAREEARAALKNTGHESIMKKEAN